MLFIKKVSCVIVILVSCVTLISGAALSIYEQQKYKALIEGQGLYSADDDVEVLTATNFKSAVYGQKHAWIIEFYNSWCGFCQRFAPSWKALASDLRSWKDLIAVGAIDCSDDNNSPICREFEVMAYPTLRYFHENFEEGPKKLGSDVLKGEDVNSHRRELLKHIVKEQVEGRGKIYPNLIPYNQPNLNHLFENVPINTKYVFLIFENDTNFGPEVAMDLHSIPQIAVKYTHKNNTNLVNALQINQFPYMVVLSDENKSQQFAPGLISRESLRMAITTFLKQNDVAVPDHQKTPEIYTGKWLEAQVPDITSLIEARERKALLDKVRKMGDVVFQMDLETVLRYALKHEVGNTKTITGERRDALVALINVLIKYFPFGRNGQEFLVQLKDNVVGGYSGKQIKDFVQNAEDNGQVFSSSQHWLACEGSSPEHRGYPCGLWKLFHYLTVNAAEVGTNQPREVLNAMHGYIKNFFGCADCSQHFQEMAKRRDINSVASAESAVIWLWMAHNEVNKRLAGDATEDPEFPKYQFPSAEKCPLCKDKDNSWNLPEVLKYLKDMYSSVNIRYIGSDTRILHAGLGSPSSGSLAMFKKLDAKRLPKKDVRTRPVGQGMR